jgi:predicted P-loop ATPase
VWWPAKTPLGAAARALRDTDAVLVQGWLLSRPYADRVKVGLDITLAGIEWAAHQRAFDSLREHVLAFPAWDGKPRELFRYFGAVDSQVHRVIGERWVRGAIARALDPGCTFGGMIILEGLQESYKNRGLEALFGSQFYAELGSIRVGTRDADQLTESTWCLHDDELKSKDAELDQLKSFVTRRSNSYVPKYGRNVVHCPRRCALVGSTNRGQYLQDDENRRFWPMPVVRRVDVEGLARDREQIFAEALVGYQAGQLWWIPPDDPIRELLRGEQADRVVVDPMMDAVRGALAKHPEDASWVTAHGLATWLGVPPERADRGFETRISRVMKDLGYRRSRSQKDGIEQRGYQRLAR